MASMVDPRLVLSAASLLLVLLLPLPAADVECCKKGADYPVKVGGVDISPDSIARGKSATFTISANTVSGLYLLLITECNPNESSKEMELSGPQFQLGDLQVSWLIHLQEHSLVSRIRSATRWNPQLKRFII